MTTPKHRSGFHAGIVNPLSLVGNEVKSILRDRSFPFSRVALLDSTGEHAGALTEMGDEPAFVAASSNEELEDLDLVFFCGPPEGNREWIERAGPGRFIAIDLSQPTTIENGTLVIAGVNLDELPARTNPIVSPHPIAIPIALVLHGIAPVAAVDSCTATVVQPASEFGQAGVEEVAAQAISVLNVKPVPRNVFDRQVAFNLFPAAEGNEDVIVSQVRAVTNPRTELALMITQGTIFHSHTFSLFLRLADEVSVETIVDALKKSSAMAFAEGDQQYGTIDAAGRDEVLIAEVRADRNVERGIWVWAVCDNLRRSSALNAVLIAEKVLFDTTTH
ncbi:MAG TPA: Asd/ArgC dimerization domain-containing protein [Thermoanaerobaculia bacterium]|nr:Asd/ArgC dimerization domain-containing protein [Thermoanaerobaculia bacterium]